jgi:hypothetical protein
MIQLLQQLPVSTMTWKHTYDLKADHVQAGEDTNALGWRSEGKMKL